MNESDSIWYAAFVKTGDEDNVKLRLQHRYSDGIKFYVPKRKLRERKDGVWHEKVHTIFPGYVLIEGNIDTNMYYGLKGVPGLWNLLRDDKDLLSISQHEIKIINKLMCNGETINESTIYEINGHVIVTDGPIKGMEGHIVKINKRKGRAKVNLSFLGEQRLIDLCVNVLTKA